MSLPKAEKTCEDIWTKIGMTAFRLKGCKASISSASAVSTSKLRVTLSCIYTVNLPSGCPR